jgi:hypothetical protein
MVLFVIISSIGRFRPMAIGADSYQLIHEQLMSER